MFDTSEPPETFEEFIEQVKATIELAEIESDEQFPLTVFVVDREENAGIIDIEDLLEKDGVDDDTDIETFIHYYFPEIVRRADSKFFAFIFSGIKRDLGKKNDKGVEIVTVLFGDLDNTDMQYSEIYRKKGQLLEVGEWEDEDPREYPDLTIPFRRAITWQG